MVGPASFFVLSSIVVSFFLAAFPMSSFYALCVSISIVCVTSVEGKYTSYSLSSPEVKDCIEATAFSACNIVTMRLHSPTFRATPL